MNIYICGSLTSHLSHFSCPPSGSSVKNLRVRKTRSTLASLESLKSRRKPTLIVAPSLALRSMREIATSLKEKTTKKKSKMFQPLVLFTYRFTMFYIVLPLVLPSFRPEDLFEAHFRGAFHGFSMAFRCFSASSTGFGARKSARGGARECYDPVPRLAQVAILLVHEEIQAVDDDLQQELHTLRTCKTSSSTSRARFIGPSL